MIRSKIVIASILKPVDDTRMYEKMGRSLAKTNKYEVNIIGFSVKNIPEEGHIKFHPIFNFSRLSLRRFWAPIKCYMLLKKINPRTIIINSHELLLMAAVFRLFNKTKLIYDVRENYYRNILYTTTFPLLLKPFLALWVRFKEYMSHLFVSHYILAEQYYEQEFSFTKGKSTIVENKYQPVEDLIFSTERHPSGTKIIFTGTLATSTGVFNAIDLAKNLHKIDQSITLEIIGYSPIKSVIENIKSRIETYDFITLTGGSELIAHAEVISKIRQANFGIICYPSNKSTINSTPTKLYEYLANQLPVIIQNHPQWQTICKANSAGIVIDYDNYLAENILNQMKSLDFYHNSVNHHFYWESEEIKLLNLLDHK